jgi:hypothetical protein
MPIRILLKEMVDALEMQSEETRVYLDPVTGKFVEISDDDLALAEDEDLDPEELPQWQRDSLPEVRAAVQALEEGRLLAVPDKFEIHEWDILRRFANGREDQRQRDELLNAIHGRGAFRMFRDCVQRLGIEPEWHQFRQTRLEAIAKDWLEAHQIAYE